MSAEIKHNSRHEVGFTEQLSGRYLEGSLIDSINDPSAIRSLSLSDLNRVCEELRSDLIETVGDVGGHFASSLGVVELTVACHKVFDTPRDRLIWDVGHQAYIHKMLTGRRNELSSVRQLGGISGFPRRGESEYDSFGVGHAGTSISAAIGMLEAFKQQGDLDRRVIAVIGDGAMTAGMAFEALNHTGHLSRNLIVVLNDNEMSISPNVGALSWAFSRALSGKIGTSARNHIKSLVGLGIVPHTFYRSLDRFEDAAQGFLSTPAMLFESFGFRYIGPVDGHNLEQLIAALECARNQDRPVLVHATTIKGKGFGPAEEDPVKYHGVDAFRKQPLLAKASVSAPTYTTVFGQSLLDHCLSDQRVVGITAAMPDGTGLGLLAQKMPERFFDVGIAEQHAVTFAAGLACEGMKPVCAIYSSFLQRAFDQVIHDVCLQSLPVVFAVDRAGVVGADGATHQGVFDIACLRSIPNLIIMAPKDEAELRDMLCTSLACNSSPCLIRYPRGSGIGADISQQPRELQLGKAEILRICNHERFRTLLIGLGTTVWPAMRAADELALNYGVECTVVNARFVKPLDSNLFLNLCSSHELIVTIEDGVISGGFGSALLETLAENGVLNGQSFIRLGVPDEFIEHATQDQQKRLCGFDQHSIVARVVEALGPSRLSHHREQKISGKALSVVGHRQ